MKKHILVVSQYFYPETFRINDMCCEWVKRGYEVTVVTGIPNYPQGRFYNGYGWLKKRTEVWNGVNIIRIPLIARGKSSIGLIMNYLSFIVSGLVWICFTKVQADYVFTFEVSPMTQALVGVWYSKRKKVPHYLYVQDLWPENIEVVAGIHNKVIINSIGKMVNYIYRNSNRIFATSPSFVKMIQARISGNEDAVSYWPQYAEEFYYPRTASKVQEIPNDNSFKIIFTGNVGYAQGLEILPSTMELLKDTDVKFVIVGDGRYKNILLREIETKNLRDKFIIIERQNADKIPDLLAACDMAFLSFQNVPLWSMTIPAKLQSYMACGMPILASAYGETERIIVEAECGICSELGNAEELATNIRYAMNCDLVEMGKKSREYFLKNFNKKKLMDEFEVYLR